MSGVAHAAGAWRRAVHRLSVSVAVCTVLRRFREVLSIILATISLGAVLWALHWLAEQRW